MEHLGKVFREFRTSGNYSLKEAAGESCSTSQLSRFELGESDLAVSRFFEILDNIHVTIENFMDKARNFHNHEHVSMMAQIIPLYYSNDIAGFQKLQREQLEKSKSSTTPLYFELNWILLQGRIGREVMEREEFYQEISRHKRLVLILALNCYQHCLEHSSFYNANYFEAYTEKIIDKGIKLYERNVFHYLKGFALYQKRQCKEGCKQMQEAIHIFDVLGLPEQVAYYQEHYEKFVKS